MGQEVRRTYEFYVAGADGEQRETAVLVDQLPDYTHHLFRPATGEEGLEAVVTFRPELNCLDQQDPALAASIRYITAFQFPSEPLFSDQI